MPQFISKFVVCSEKNKATSTAGDISASDEESDLNAHLQKQLEEDVARIFDESIYSDLEVVCGKLKILTHTCILKTRTSKFFHQLESILHANIGRKTFDEIYSFVSDAYTECNIKHQEHEIIKYLNETFNTLSPILNKASPAKEDISEAEAFCISDCIVNSWTENNFSKTKRSSPNTELTKEYYALVPINGNLLENELIEQDKLSNAFLSIIKTQVDDKIKTELSPSNKPTSLSLYEEKTIIHSNNLSTCLQSDQISDSKFEDCNEKLFRSSSQVSKFNNSLAVSHTSDPTFRNFEPSAEKVLDSTYSPDSLITDELSSSSDYLSATFTCSSGTSISSYYHNLKTSDNFVKMERNNFNVTDSGIENTGIPENANNQLDVTLTDISLSESNLHSCNPEEAVNSQQYAQALMVENIECQRSMFFPSASEDNIADGKETDCYYTNKPHTRSGKSIKEEKQRQNEEIVTIESSSLSSETGAWESVFPPKFIERDRHIIKHVTKKSGKHFRDNKLQDLKRADSFVAEETVEVNLHKRQNETKVRPIPIPSQPISCADRYARCSSEVAEGNDKEDYDLNESSSITILGTSKSNEDIAESASGYARTLYSGNAKTPNNSILSVRENSEDKLEFKDFIPKSTCSSNYWGQQIKSNGDHINKSTIKRDINNIPIVSGAYKPEVDDNQQPIQVTQSKSTCGSAWIVEMSNKPEVRSSLTLSSENSDENIPENSKFVSNGNDTDNNKIQGIVESDVNEKSSHTYFIDLSSLPEPAPSNKNNETARVNEKDNMFTMYIDIGENSTLKGKPPTLHSINSRKSSLCKPKISNKTVSNKMGTTEPNQHTDKKKNNGNNSLIVFEELESLCNNPNISVNEIIKKQETLKDTCVIMEIKPDVELNKNDKPMDAIVTNKNCQMPTITTIDESVTTDLNKDTDNNNLFVKLSDLDKPITKPSNFDKIKSKVVTAATLYEGKVWDARMTRSIPDNNWGDPSFSGNSCISSFHSENALSLNRLFPNLINKYSRSVPASLSIRTRSFLRLDNSLNMPEEDKQLTNTSEISSMQNSACQSVLENSTTEETSRTNSVAVDCQSRLGQDLLRMFLEEIATDVVVEVNGKRIKAHKCILSSRCQYFAGILSGGYVESAGNVIVLPSFSYSVTHFVMCHIYAGISIIPDSISIIELATLADMLGLEGLKEAIMYTLKAKYCHHFHKPCEICVAGVLECLTLCSAYGLDDLYRKCLKWITKYYMVVWPTKAFATLPAELLEKCYNQQTLNFTIESLVDSVFGYGMIMASLQNNRWGELLHRMCLRLIQAAAHYTSRKLVEVLCAIEHMPSNVPPPAKVALEDCVVTAIEWAQPEEACRAYAFLSNTVKDMKSQQSTKPDNTNRKMSRSNNLLFNYAAGWRLQCEGALVRAAPRVVGTKAFQDLPSELRKRLRELGCISYVSHATSQISMSPYNKIRGLPNRDLQRCPLNTRNLDIVDHVRAAFVPYSTKPAIPVANIDLSKNCYGVREPIRQETIRTRQPPKVRMTKAQEQRAIFNNSKNALNRKPVKTYVPAVVKSKYLEPKAPKETGKPTGTTNKVGGEMISSNESSLNSSPNQTQRYRMASATKHQIYKNKSHGMSQDSLATSSRSRTAEPSTDSQSESHNNKFATYTKVKREIKGSVESIHSMKCHTVTTRNVELQGSPKVKKLGSVNQQMKPIKSPADAMKRLASATVGMKSTASSSGAIPKVPCKRLDKITSGSLMSATKSSSAKIVAKVVKNNGKKTNKAPSKTSDMPHDNTLVMNRSGTFFIDEPTIYHPTRDYADKQSDSENE